MDEVDAIVVGAGVVGLAIARALACSGRQTVLVERERAIGTGTSSRNSEVIHAGLYYPAGSLKARLCVRGRRLLYRYAAAHGVPHHRCGKLIVATREEDAPRLAAIRAAAAASGVADLVPLSAAEARTMEPELHCTAALHSPSSGIVDSHALMLALQGDAEREGALLALASPFEAARRDGARWIVRTGGAEPFELGTRWLVNSAGLAAQQVARAIEGLPASAVPARRLAKGHYFSLAGRAPFSRLVYPVPVDGGLGVHLTLDLGGQARFGPDVEWLAIDEHAEPDYAVDPGRAEPFYAEVRRYWPRLADGALAPSYSGVRPKLSGPGEPAADFRIDGPEAHGLAGLVNLYGIESPGLTASLAIGESVVRRLDPAWPGEGAVDDQPVESGA